MLQPRAAQSSLGNPSKDRQRFVDADVLISAPDWRLLDLSGSTDEVIKQIMGFAKRLVNADRCALFLVDPQTDELYANLFDEGYVDEKGECVFSKQKEIRFPMTKGVAGHVASHGEVLNVTDAYSDKRFNREVDAKTGYTTNTLLCVPVICKHRVIGVVEMVNKEKGVFTDADIQCFQMFAGYCGLALYYSKIGEDLSTASNRLTLMTEVAVQTGEPSTQEIKDLRESARKLTIPADLNSHTFSPYINIETFPSLFRHMSKKIFKKCQIRVNNDILDRFIMTVKKFYRPLAYHSWEHAFSVAHLMYVILEWNEDRFDRFEMIALFIACICHDLDHRGKNNAFFIKTGHPLGLLYETSAMERHHFDMTLLILQQESCDVLHDLSKEDRKQVVEYIEEAIIATDLAMFFENVSKVQQLLESNSFNWNNKEHRWRIRSLMMTACDICAASKDWDTQLESVDKVYMEFYAQGDEEKKHGISSLPIMDRTQEDKLPENQVGFLGGIALPCFSALNKLLKNIGPMVDNVRNNLEKWKVALNEAPEKIKELSEPGTQRNRLSLSFLNH